MRTISRLAHLVVVTAFVAMIAACAAGDVESAGDAGGESASASPCESDPTEALRRSFTFPWHTWVRATALDQVDAASIPEARDVLESGLTGEEVVWAPFVLGEPSVVRSAASPATADGPSVTTTGSPDETVPGADGTTPTWVLLDANAGGQVAAAAGRPGWLAEIGFGGTVVNLLRIDGDDASFIGGVCASPMSTALAEAAGVASTSPQDLAVRAIQGDPAAMAAISGSDPNAGAPASAPSWADSAPRDRYLDTFLMTPDVRSQVRSIRFVVVAPDGWRDADTAPSLCVLTPVAWSDCLAPQSLGAGPYQLDTSMPIITGSGFELWARWKDGREVRIGSADAAVTESGVAYVRIDGGPGDAGEASATIDPAPAWAPTVDDAGSSSRPDLPAEAPDPAN